MANTKQALVVALAAALLTPVAANAVVSNVHYGPAGKQAMDVYPAVESNARLVVLVHGSGWKAGDKTEVKTEALSLQEAGFSVFDANYRLDSKTLAAFPMEVEDVEAATRYAVDHATTYNADASNVVLVGGSAGGNLVGMAGERMNATIPGTVAGIVTLSGAFDFPSLVQDDREGKFPLSFGTAIPQALGCELETTCRLDETFQREWSPTDHVGAPCAPWLIFNGEVELMTLDQPNAMTQALEAQACPVTERVLAGKPGHSFAYWPTVKAEVMAFISAH